MVEDLLCAGLVLALLIYPGNRLSPFWPASLLGQAWQGWRQPLLPSAWIQFLGGRLSCREREVPPAPQAAALAGSPPEACIRELTPAEAQASVLPSRISGRAGLAVLRVSREVPETRQEDSPSDLLRLGPGQDRRLR